MVHGSGFKLMFRGSWFRVDGPQRGLRTFHEKSTCPGGINLKVLRSKNSVPYPPESGGNETIVVHQVVGRWFTNWVFQQPQCETSKPEY
jgi:hypothetical protein